MVSIISNLGTLFVFKYFNFFNVNLAALAHLFDWNYSASLLNLILPLGLSYHIFQSLSYVIEVYYGRFSAERHYGIYALYVMFFPQLVAGPIEKPQWLLPQLHRFNDMTKSNLREGLERMGWGFFKKVIIADNIGYFVDAVYNNLHVSHGPTLLAGMVAFAIQLYADFSGYSDIAVGTARVFGITLINNFNFPFFSRSVAELWRRWHISLSTWARDYVYYPLAVSWAKIGRGALYLAVMVTFILIGLWHGAGWTFIMMGVFFGGYIVIGILTRPWRTAFAEYVGLTRAPVLYGIVQTVITFLLSCVGWVFFRAQSIGDAFYFIGHLATGWSGFLAQRSFASLSPVPLPQPTFSIALISTVFLIIVEFIEFRYHFFSRFMDAIPYLAGLHIMALPLCFSSFS